MDWSYEWQTVVIVCTCWELFEPLGLRSAWQQREKTLPRGERKELTPIDCPLTFTCCQDKHMCHQLQINKRLKMVKMVVIFPKDSFDFLTKCDSRGASCVHIRLMGKRLAVSVIAKIHIAFIVEEMSLGAVSTSATWCVLTVYRDCAGCFPCPSKFL